MDFYQYAVLTKTAEESKVLQEWLFAHKFNWGHERDSPVDGIYTRRDSYRAIQRVNPGGMNCVNRYIVFPEAGSGVEELMVDSNPIEVKRMNFRTSLKTLLKILPIVPDSVQEYLKKIGYKMVFNEATEDQFKLINQKKVKVKGEILII